MTTPPQRGSGPPAADTGPMRAGVGPGPGAGPGSGAESGAGRAARGRAALDVLLRVCGGVLVLAGGLVAAVLAVLLVPLRLQDFGASAEAFGWSPGSGIGAVRVPVAVLVAAGGNLLLLRLARLATGARWGVLLPGLGWFAVIIAALRVTTEGDRLLMPNDWVATLTLFTGTLVLVIGTVLSITPSRGQVRSADRGGGT